MPLFKRSTFEMFTHPPELKTLSLSGCDTTGGDAPRVSLNVTVTVWPTLALTSEVGSRISLGLMSPARTGAVVRVPAPGVPTHITLTRSKASMS